HSITLTSTRHPRTYSNAPQYNSPVFFFFQAEDGIRDRNVTGVQTCALPILRSTRGHRIGVACIAVGLILLAACGSNESEQARESDRPLEYSVPDWAHPVLAEGKDEPPGVKIASFDETPLRVDVYQLRSKDPEAQRTPAGYLYALNYVATNTGTDPLDLTASTFRMKPTGVD